MTSLDVPDITTPIHDRHTGSLLRAMLVDPRAWAGAVAVVAVVVVTLLGPLIAPTPPGEFVARAYAAPAPGLPLGADNLGRDVLSRVLVGGGAFLVEGLIAAALGIGVGVVLGMLIGISGRRTAGFLLFLSDSVMVIPQILLVLIILAAFGANPVTLTVSVALAQIAYTARVVNAATQGVVTEDYFRAARASGAGRAGLLFREVLPNIIGVVLVEFGVRLSVCFVALASLSYLGFSSGAVSWGAMIHENQGGITLQPLAVFAPVIMIAVFLLGMNLVRDALARAVAGRSAR
ncbi:ABC transporter permease [Herbiconiux ginsengi]|uniref:Peptide/nickel transport system permease protein n=1 Tax=Herbiconiux ginsengi TaxID=381665 RepID=A0A1H3PE12_9MICO|nr:ABC transporter permease [Herbiconiux ginsengi]SDY99402.1 peptide/nickel transport system permease protein [Herbiconiux ginsengi]